MVTRTTQVTQVHLSNDVVKVTEYYTVTPSPSITLSSSISSKSSSPSVVSSTVVLISTQVEASTVFSVVTVNGTQSQQQVSTLYITQSANSTSIQSSSTESSSSELTSTSGDSSSSADLVGGAGAAASSSPTEPTISSTASATSSDSELSTSEAPTSDNENKSAFFSDTGKVAGTFTAVGVVVLGIVSAILYCCCCCTGRRRGGVAGVGGDRDTSDEENRYSLDYDDVDVAHEKLLRSTRTNEDINAIVVIQHHRSIVIVNNLHFHH